MNASTLVSADVVGVSRTATVQKPTLISLRGVTKSYTSAAGAFLALDEITIDIPSGELVAVVGQSGSGKSTLLNIVSGIDRVTSGTVHVGDVAVHEIPERKMASWRGRSIGIVFQFFQLLPTLSVIENVMLPMDFCNKWAPRERKSKAESLLARLGIADQRDKLPNTLSGGQQQRAAIARALANDPQVLIADEPTGNLDSRNAESILELFVGLVKEGQTVLTATHDTNVQRVATRIINIADGRLVTTPSRAHA